MDRSIPMLRATGQDETRSSMKFRCTRQVMPTGLPAWPLPMVAGWIRTAGRRRGRILQQSSFREDDVERSHHRLWIDVGLRGLQLDNQPLWLPDALQKPILVVVRIALKVHLRNKPVLSSADIEVDVGRTKRVGPGRIGRRLDRLELVASVRIRQRDAEALEVRVDWRSVGIAR